MKITFSPTRGPAPLTVTRSGDTLCVNGTVLDFTDLADGETRPAEDYDADLLAGAVTRTADQIALTLIVPHGPAAPQETLFPAPVTLTDDGPVPLPPFGG